MATDGLTVVWDGSRNGPGGGHLSDYSVPEWPGPETAQQRRRRPPWVRAGLTRTTYYRRLSLARERGPASAADALELLRALVLAR